MGSNESFGRELRRLRRSHPSTISLADMAKQIDCSITYLSAIERDDRNPPSNEKIAKLLKYLDAEAELPRMLQLAVQARKAVEIPVDGTSNKIAHVLLGLARRREEGGLGDDDPLVQELEKLLNERNH